MARVVQVRQPYGEPPELLVYHLGNEKETPVSICAIRYRFDGPGPASFLVEYAGKPRIYCRGLLSAPLSDGQVKALLTDPKRHWVAASGELVIETVDAPWVGIAGALPMDAGDTEYETAS